MSKDLVVQNAVSNVPQYVADQDGGATALALSSTNIGIGTLTPACALEVAGDISVGSSTVTTPTGYGNKLIFNGVANNSDTQWIAKYNVAFNVSSLRVNVADDNAVGGDTFDVGYTYHLSGQWTSILSASSAGIVNVNGALQATGTITAKALALSLPLTPAVSTANLTPLMIDRTTGKIYALN